MIASGAAVPAAGGHRGHAEAGRLAVPEQRLQEAARDLDRAAAALDIPGKRRELARLRTAAAEPGTWSDPDHAVRLSGRLAGLERQLGAVTDLAARLEDTRTLFQLAQEEGDAAAHGEAGAELDALTGQIAALARQASLTGEHDHLPALLTITPRSGGEDAQQWAAALLDMYTAWAHRRGDRTEVYDIACQAGVGIRHATLAVHGEYAYGLLRGEHGVHRRVHISEFDTQRRRQTGFAAVEVAPLAGPAALPELRERDLRVDVFRASGPGGQGVNTTDSAVRVTHLPTGISATCRKTRSQAQNKATALKVLYGKLLHADLQEREAERARRRGQAAPAAWGAQIRNYILMPYQLVKDVRTGVQTHDVAAVLDGAIDPFIDAMLRHSAAAHAAA
ncbi:peptide chain release factor 2 [Bailinhaonella thermotolerans]|uniref:Peptide chain release factor 2 n=1 Tax=Bailinhaonella thermotolerans TaxID=1070861 RepID=A0A3A4AB09_9ACTN|nr:peptide chain release factor 2 [Bailinhaonella thermotolerans]RJL24017.1 PCRF domain-containing protein [Bailinhaonella thermotolerans]